MEDSDFSCMYTGKMKEGGGGELEEAEELSQEPG